MTASDVFICASSILLPLAFGYLILLMTSEDIKGNKGIK